MTPLRLLPLLLLSTFCLTSGSFPLRADDILLETRVKLETPKKKRARTEGELDEAPLRLWLPGSVEEIRGLIVNPFYTKAVTQKHWQAMGRHWKFGILASNLFGVRQDEFARVVDAGLETFARESGHPELVGTRLVLVGMSAGAGMSVRLAQQLPGRTIAVGPVCLEVGPRDAPSMEIPMLTIFGERDGKQYEKLRARLGEARPQGARFGIAIQWRRRHEFALANNLLVVHFDAAIRARLRGRDEPLVKLPESSGWLGDAGAWEEGLAPISPAAEFSGDRKTTCWLPDATTAHAWQSFVTRRPGLVLKTPAGLGDGQPLVLHPAGKPVEVTGQALDGVEIEGAIEVRAGEKVLGTLADGRLTITPAYPGPVPLFLAARDASGKPLRSRLSTLIITAP